jgi:hypothetical protein
MTIVSREFINEVLNSEDFDSISAVCEVVIKKKNHCIG